jgi:hypothetical protein
MAKLLSTDYLKIIKETYDLPYSDYENHYLNTININYPQNRDVVNNLLYELNQLKREYDYEVSSLIKDQPKEFLKSVERTLVQIPQRTALRFTTIDGQFFILSKAVLNKIADLIKLTNEVKEIESGYTKEQVNTLNIIAEFPKEFNFETLCDRLNAHEKLNYKIGLNNLKKVKFKPQSFNDLLKDEYQSKALAFMQILHVADSPVVDMPNHISKDCKELVPLLNEAGEWIGNRQAARVFYEVLLSKGVIVKRKISNIKYAKVFNTAFGINVSFVSQPPGDNANVYKAFFIKEIDKILTEITNRDN